MHLERQPAVPGKSRARSPGILFDDPRCPVQAIGIIPPAPKVHARDLPLWRVLFEIGRNSVGIWSERAFDDFVIVKRQLGVDSLLVNDPEGVSHVLAGAADKYVRPPASSPRIARPLTGAGLLLAEAAEWRRQRRMLAPLFTPASVGRLLPHFHEASNNMVSRLAGRDWANLSAEFHTTALDAVLRALFSLPVAGDPASFAGMVREYVSGPGRPNLFDGLARKETDFPFAGRARRSFAEKRRSAVGAMVANRRAAGRRAAARPDLLDLLLAARDPDTGQGLSDDEVGDQAATMLFAGFETTSRLLFWAAYLLTLDIAEQARVRQEVDAFPPDRVTKLEDLSRWPQLRATLLEALRLYPPVPNLVRHAVAADVVAGTPVRPGTRVWISPWVIHRHRRLWRDPTAFRPDRWEREPTAWTSVPGYLPFGGGPRICIGAAFAMAEATIVLATLLSQFEFGLVSGNAVSPVGGLTLVPSHEPAFALRTRF